MAQVFAFANQKGGVGKTTLSTQFAFFLQKKGAKVLFLDMDAQGNATDIFMEHEDFTGTSVADLFVDSDLDLNIVHTHSGIDLLGSYQEDDEYEVEALPMEKIANPTKWLTPVMDNYDYVVVDCPPGLGRLMVASLYFADYVIAPVRLSAYANRGLNGLFRTIYNLQDVNPNVNILGIAVNDYRDTRNQKDALEAIDEALPGLVFKTIVHTRTPIDEAGPMCMSIADLPRKPESLEKSIEELYSLFNEILDRVEEQKVN